MDVFSASNARYHQTDNMDILANNSHYQLQLVNSIKKTFKGSSKMADVLSSLNTLFCQVDESLVSDGLISKTPEQKCERETMLGVIIVLLDHIIKDQNNTIQHETISRFLTILKSGLNRSMTNVKIQKELSDSKSLLLEVKTMFKAEDVSDQDVENLSQRIAVFFESSDSMTNVMIELQEGEEGEEDREDIENIESKLLDGWLKNQHELKKRCQKLNHFHGESNEKLFNLEKSIDESKQRNEQFRSILDKTSDKIALLINQLNDANKQSSFLQNQINIVESTISDMERCKQKSDEEYTKLEEQLSDKQNTLVQCLKNIDCSLDNSLTKHQILLEKNGNFNEAMEELARCYSDFENQEHLIIQKYHLPKVDHFNGDSIILQQQQQQDHRRIEELEKENHLLAIDLDDIFQLNRKLKDENMFVHSEMERMSLSKITESVRDDEVEYLKSENIELRRKMEKTDEVRTRVESVCGENKELILENNQLLEQVDMLEEQIKKFEDGNINMKIENETLRSNLEKINNVYHPRILRIKTDAMDTVALVNDTVKLVKEPTNEERKPTNEELLQHEHDLNISLEKSQKVFYNLYSALSNISRRIGLEKLRAGVSYVITIESSEENLFCNHNGFILTESEVQSITSKKNRTSDIKLPQLTKAQEEIVDELTAMLHESYLSCDHFKQTNKQLKEKIEILEKSLEKRNMDAPARVDEEDGDKKSTYTILGSFIQLYEEMGIGALQRGTTYTIHYQAVDKAENDRRPSRDFQYSTKAVDFENIRNLMANHNSANKPPPIQSFPRRKISHVTRHSTVFKRVTNEDENEAVLRQIKNSNSNNTQELERLLRIAKRENIEILNKNRMLRRELTHHKEIKSRFSQTKEKLDNSGTEEFEEPEENKESLQKQMVHPEEVEDLERAYKLSEANCSFLENQNSRLSQRINHAECVTHQMRDEMFDKDEQMQCMKQQIGEQSKKAKENEREINELKKDIEYLENEAEFCRLKLMEAGIEHNPNKVIAHTTTPKKEFENASNADLQLILTEKNSLILECENLTARIKFLDAEKRFALEEARILNAEKIQWRCQQCKASFHVSKEDEIKETSNVENEVKSKGLAKHFNTLQKEFKRVKEELDRRVAEHIVSTQTIDELTIKREALQITNSELEDKIILLEQQTFLDQTRLEDLRKHESRDIVGSIDQDNSTFLVHENEEIRESNRFLLRRNSHLRRESLAADVTKKQVELLQEKLNNLENENVVLKLESMNHRGRRRTLTRRLSQQCDEIMEIKTFKLNDDRCTKSTQTEEKGKEEETNKVLQQNESDMDFEEMQFVIEDLTKRNTEFKTNLSAQEQEIASLISEVKKQGDINKKLSTELAAVKKISGLTGKPNSSYIDSEFEETEGLECRQIAELVDQNEILKYENQMLKQDVIEFQRKITPIQTFDKKSANTELVDTEFNNTHNVLEIKSQSNDLILTRDESPKTDSCNGTVDELFEVKFLLESNSNYYDNDKVDVKSNSSQSDDDGIFQECIQEGELVSEMDEFFRKFSEERSSTSVLDENLKNGQEEKEIDDKADTDVEVWLEKDVEGGLLCETNVPRETKSTEVDALRRKIKLLENKIQDYEEKLKECNKSLTDQQQEISHHLLRIKDLEKHEESLCADIEHFQLQVREKESLLENSTSSIKEYKYKIEALKKELQDYHAMTDDQEKLLQATHDQSTIMQNNFNDLYKQSSVKSGQMEDLAQQLQDKVSHLEEIIDRLHQSEQQNEVLQNELMVVKTETEQLSGNNILLENTIQKYEKKLTQLEQNLNYKLEWDEEMKEKIQYAEVENKGKDQVIEKLKKQLCDSEDMIALYEERSGQQDIFNGSQCMENNISMEIREAFLDSKTATEVSLDNGDFTLPEIRIMDDSSKIPSLSSSLCERCQSQKNHNNSLLSTKYMNPNSGALSEVSDIESSFEDSDSEKTYSSKYVEKLKKKLKVSRNKIKDRNKIILNQNVDLDNFLEDIRNKDMEINAISNQLKQLEKEANRMAERQQPDGLLSFDTPDFSKSESYNKEEIINELITLAEDCCAEISNLRDTIDRMKLISQIPYTEYEQLHLKLNTSEENIQKLKNKLSRYVELGFISQSETFSEQMSHEFILTEPSFNQNSGKTVNEIRNDNEMLITQNIEMKIEIEALKKQVCSHDDHPNMNSSAISYATGIDVENRANYDHQSHFEEIVTTAETGTLGDIATLSHTETLLDGIAARKDSLNSGTHHESDEKLRSLTNELSTAQQQIEKDWIIIHNQSNQLENLHQQFIEQRDQNLNSMLQIQQKDEQLMEKEDKIQTLLQRISDNQVKSKGKEEELGRILEEKEDGIEKLHLMIFELEKSLSNSQVHIEGILRESMFARENEALKDSKIKDYENQITQLNREIKQLKVKPTVLRLPENIDPVSVTELQSKIDDVKNCKSTLENEFLEFQTQWKADIQTVSTHLHNLAGDQRQSSHVNCTPNKASSDDDDDEALFVPKQKNHATRRHSEHGDWKIKFEDKETEYVRLQEQFVQQEEMLQKKEKIHAVEIDTIIKSLTNKRAHHHVLTPSTNLVNTGQADFLYKCLQEVKRSDHSGAYSAP